MCVHGNMCGYQRTACRSQFSSTVWVPGIHLKSSNLAARTFTHQVILWVSSPPCFSLFASALLFLTPLLLLLKLTLPISGLRSVPVSLAMSLVLPSCFPWRGSDFQPRTYLGCDSPSQLCAPSSSLPPWPHPPAHPRFSASTPTATGI